MTSPTLPRWFNLLTAVGSVIALIFIGADTEVPNRRPEATALTVTARHIDVPKGNVDIPTALSLRLTDAWELTSSNAEFGGLSAMYASGGALTFISDHGALTRLGRDTASPRWIGVAGPLPTGCGNMEDKHQRDTESLVMDARTGSMWIGFEHRNGICRIASKANGGTVFVRPTLMRHWRQSGGPEAMVRLRNGGFLVFEEVPKEGGATSSVIHFDRDPADPNAKTTLMRYRPPTGYNPVDAAQLPDGRILVLNRRFALPFNFTNRLSIFSLPKIQAGAVLAGPIIARIDGEGIADNFEALSIDNDGEDLTIWLASDNNFMTIQRSLLLRFIWPGAARVE